VVISQDVAVARPRADVYEFLVDTANFKKVDRALVAYEPEGRMEVGTRGTMRHRRGGMTARTTWHVTELVPDERLAVEIRGMGYWMQELVELSDDGAGTAMRVVDTLAGTSLLGRLFVAISGGFIRRDLEARLSLLRTALATAQK
jgi:carbon monoxide dehydrogenase subunit G